jgi:hypothetical protein
MMLFPGIWEDAVFLTTCATVQILFSVIGFTYWARRGQVARLKSSQFQGVTLGEFVRWQTLELLSIDSFLTIAWGPCVAGVLACLAVCFDWPILGGCAFVLTLLLYPFVLFSWLVSGTMAVRLKKKLGIPVS